MHGSSPIPDRAWPRACSRWHPGVGRRPSGRGVVRFGHCRAGSSEREVVCRQESAPVHCRIGSSETLRRVFLCPNGVHCRIGSSENIEGQAGANTAVHCRIGSSENLVLIERAIAVVHCRRGSSEIVVLVDHCSAHLNLPHRQPGPPSGPFSCQARAHREHARLLLTQRGQRVLQRLDQSFHIPGRHIDPGRGHRQTCRCLGRVLEADERLSVHNARADAGELKEGRGSHGAMVAWKAHSWLTVVQTSKGFRSRPSIQRGGRPCPAHVSPVLGLR